MIGAAGELDCSSGHIHLREPGKSEDKVKCEAIDSSVIGLATLWYRRGRTFMESSVPCSHVGRALVVTRVEKVEIAEANSKYQDKAEGQRSGNFIRSVSMGLSSR
ncbi:hypothetical protein BHE74_00001515 [Ensete ventricosum]|nr:hypothetical protein GW17_00009375 [Ensete ventricosum]RWW89537.1 hypothetical protein BHE74_00001515 [Ensete ventricosum]RZR80450.1 hypothetical protein BHM03_00006498 [Ensete ventricosum]